MFANKESEGKKNTQTTQSSETVTSKLNLEDAKWTDATEADVQKHLESHTHAGMRFQGFEHRAIGNQAFQRLLEWYHHPQTPIGTPQNNVFQLISNKFFYNSGAHTFRFKTMDNTPFELSAGDIVALAGDFFGVAKKEGSICTGADEAKRRERFEAAYNTLVQLKNKNDVLMIEELKGEFEKEYGVVLSGLMRAILPSESIKTFEAIERVSGRDRNFVYNAILSHHALFSDTKLGGAQGKYITLARYNFDHFGGDAKLAFKAGFQSAYERIRDAKKPEKNATQKAFALFEAFTQLLFACHFLTDLFAAGHLRTPRRALFHYARQKKFDLIAAKSDYVSGMLVKEMHDEDNQAGLNVRRDVDNQRWVAYGDGCYFNPSNDKNQDKVVEAVVVAFKELIEFYHDKSLEKQPDYLYEKYLPTTEGCENREPMFQVEPGSSPVQISLRGDLVQPPSRERVTQWTPQSVWSRLKKRHTNPIEEILKKAADVNEQEKITAEEARHLLKQQIPDYSEATLGQADNPTNDGATVPPSNMLRK